MVIGRPVLYFVRERVTVRRTGEPCSLSLLVKEDSQSNRYRDFCDNRMTKSKGIEKSQRMSSRRRNVKYLYDQRIQIEVGRREGVYGRGEFS